MVYQNSSPEHVVVFKWTKTSTAQLLLNDGRTTNWKENQEAYGPLFAHLSKTAIAYLQMPCNIFPVLPQQLGHKFDHALKCQRSSWDHHLNKLGRPGVPDAIFSLKAFLVLEKIVKCLITIYGHGGHLFKWWTTIKQIVNIPLTEGPMRKLAKRL